MGKQLDGKAELFLLAGFFLLAPAAIELRDFLSAGHPAKELADAGGWALLAGLCEVLAWLRRR